jgi:hypothetical protein
MGRFIKQFFKNNDRQNEMMAEEYIRIEYKKDYAHMSTTNQLYSQQLVRGILAGSDR